MAKIKGIDKELLDSMYNLRCVGDISQAVFYDFVRSQFGELTILRSILMEASDEKKFRDIIEIIRPKRVVEIGTAKGISALLMSVIADNICTFDILDYPEKYILWNIHNVNNKIQFYHCENNDDKKEELDKMDFDFAFIDGDHSFSGVSFDFGCVNKCGRVLFHDYFLKDTKHSLAKEYPKYGSDYGNHNGWDVTNFVDSLPKEEVTINEPFAYWEKR